MNRNIRTAAVAGLLLIGLAGVTTEAYGSPVLEIVESDTQVVSGSGRLDILLFTGNAVGNPAGMPAPNGDMPGNASVFSGDYAVPGDPETLMVGELLDWLHANRSPDFHLLQIEIDVNEPGAGKKHPMQVDAFTVAIGGTVFALPTPTVLDAPDNGSGISDYVIGGTEGGINLTQFDRLDVISFHLEASRLDAGFEEFFISSAPIASVPEPTTMGLLGIGFGAMLLRRRR